FILPSKLQGRRRQLPRVGGEFNEKISESVEIRVAGYFCRSGDLNRTRRNYVRAGSLCDFDRACLRSLDGGRRRSQGDVEGCSVRVATLYRRERRRLLHVRFRSGGNVRPHCRGEGL